MLSELPPAPLLQTSFNELNNEHLQLLQWLLLASERALHPCACLALNQLKAFLRPTPEFWQSLGPAAAAASAIFLVHGSMDAMPRASSLNGSVPRHGFHGTAFDNLHSILHKGLLNFSGMKMQRNGALYGQGVYLSEDFNVAFSFCNGAKGLENSVIGTRLRVVLVCQVPEEVHHHISSERRWVGFSHEPSP
jgi:poly[ADP-ribose] polymerase 16